ncbi:hypothetical protein AS589_09375 [Empedobacter brevis]|uniref:hypothetical protein n=1 Tax=Empedobacter brevis TaxID=247 RepID=UPI00132013E9|nr:hypothetical protein [Empedobacter brevis]QHC84966.1 hypothetical protein AS589_09375 [Empedobacter brevis]
MKVSFEELRISCNVFYNNDIVEIRGVDFDSALIVYEHTKQAPISVELSDLKPIPLNKNVLYELGYEYDLEILAYESIGPWQMKLFTKDNKIYEVDMNLSNYNQKPMKLKYVHQIQNLEFGLFQQNHRLF